MAISLSVVIDFFGVLFGLIFIYLNIRSARSVIGSVFKRYHRWMIAGAVCFTLGFFFDVTFTSFLGIGSVLGESAHDVFLLAAAIIFVITNLSLPREAAEYMGQPKADAS